MKRWRFLLAAALAVIASPAIAQSEVVVVSPSEIEMMPAATAEARLADRGACIHPGRRGRRTDGVGGRGCKLLHLFERVHMPNSPRQ